MARARAVYEIVTNDRSSRSVRNVQRRFQDLSSSVTVLQGPLSGAAGRLTALGAGLSRAGPIALGFGLAIAGTTKLVASGVSAFSQYERQLLRTQALLRSTGNAAGFSGQQIDRMAKDLGLATLTSAGAARDAANILLTFRSIAGDTFQRTLILAQDLAEVMGSDLRSTTLQLAKALEDPERGLTMLRRSGVSFTQSQTNMIKEMVRGGELLKAQGVILDQVSAQVGGAGEGAAGGLAGAVDSLKERWTEFLEVIGSSSAGEAAGDFLKTLADGIDNVNKSLERGLNGREDNSQATLLKEQLRLQTQIADLEAKQTDQLGNRALNAGLIDSSIKALKTQLIGVEAAIRVNEDYEKVLQDRAKALKETAVAEADAAAKTDANAQLLQKFDKQLQTIRKSLGSKTLALEDQQKQVKAITLAYELGMITLKEFNELQDKALKADKITQGGQVDSISRFFGTVGNQTQRPSPPLTREQLRVAANEEEKKQTQILMKIERGLFVSRPAAVTS